MNLHIESGYQEGLLRNALERRDELLFMPKAQINSGWLDELHKAERDIVHVVTRAYQSLSEERASATFDGQVDG